MINVEEALKVIKEQAIFRGNELLDLPDTVNRIISTDILADRDFPPFDRVSMDGIAISFQDWENGNRTYNIEHVVAAGTAQYTLQTGGNCVEIMTGAVLPKGLDTVIRYEDLIIENNKAKVNIEDIRKGQNVHPKGFDQNKDACLIKRGKRIGSPEIGIAATVGKESLWVKKVPSCLLVSTGDELVDIDEKPLPHQIRRSNVYTLQAQLRNWGVATNLLHLNDNKNDIREKLDEAFRDYDAIILSGAVSKGKFDFLPEILEDLGVEKIFHKIAQRPGKPFWFGNKINGPVIFALPGNPVSSFMCTCIYFKAWLDESLGIESVPLKAELGADFHFKPDLAYFAQIKLYQNEMAKIIALPYEGKGSGDLANLGNSNAFLWLPRGRNTFKKGELHTCFPFASMLDVTN